MPDFSVAVALLRKPIEDLYSSASGSLKTKIASIRAQAKIKALHKLLYDSQRVKTIWNPDRALSLTSFFYPVSIQTASGATRLNSLDDLPDNHNIIFGTVGQGKSILLRYLLGKEIKSGARVPVLAELRDVEKQSLEEHLCERFSLLLGIKKDFELFSGFASAGKISFFLDGFDEIDPELVPQLTKQIEDLSFRFNSCRIIVTSRPDSECGNLTRFSAQKIFPLAESDLESFYKKITRDPEFTARLMAAIRVSPLKIKELVTTPLLATLLAISYRAAQRIPLDFAEFYEDLFQILLVRHDASKLGWRRNRKTKLNDREIQQVFEAFCFASKKRKAVALDRDLAYELARESIQELQYQVDPLSFIEDIKKITCLLQDEGKKISFVHLSIQEFFASRYVKTRPEAVAAKFYEQLANGKWTEWYEEILFLTQIDAHRARKYLLVPDIEKTLKSILGGLSGKLSEESFVEYLKGLSVIRINAIRNGKNESSFGVRRLRPLNTQHYRRLDQIAYDILFSRSFLGCNTWRVGFESDLDCDRRTWFQIAKDRGEPVMDQLKTSISNAVNGLVFDREIWSKSVTHAEVPRNFMDIG